MGHEYCGIVEEVGSAVKSVKPGHFVIGSFFASDNTCSDDGTAGVATSVPSASGTRSTGACAVPPNSRGSQDDGYPHVQLGEVLSDAKNEPMTKWPGFTDLTALPTSSTIPQYSCPIGVGSGTGLMPR